MIPHNMPLFKFICALYQFHHQTLPIMKIDRGQIQFRDYVFTGTEPNAILCRFDSMVQKFGQQLKKNYSKVYSNLIYIKIFPFA